MAADIERPDMRISDAERDEAIAHLQACAGEGRIDLDEFDDRCQAVAVAKTFGDLARIMADLPRPDKAKQAAADSLELAPKSSSLSRRGRWLVPKRIALRPKGSSIKLNFTDAAIGHQEIDIVLDSKNSSIVLVLPENAYAEENVALKASSMSNRVPFTGDTRGVRFTISGTAKTSSVTVRRLIRFLWWTF
ncbi:MAG TPA: DUF1707 domain-containing protein [Candidatus Stackebrandtia excrementipullorum]|nr:DUF1707 domain-containing protein [Candidatus Stackebrandtia excrementipullorum]